MPVRFRLAPPRRRDLAEAAALVAGVTATALALQAATGFLGPADPGLSGRLWLLALALIVPVLVEELVFRGPLLLARFRTMPMAALLLVAFIAWHPLQAMLLRPDLVPLFSSAPFLIAAAALGLAATLSAWRSGSLLLPIVIHWVPVAGWIVVWGGPKGMT